VSVVIEAGEVQTGGLAGLVKRAECLVLLYTDLNELAGVAAVKRPNETYRRNVFRKANSPENPDRYPYEIGWVVVREGFRGLRLSHVLLEAALEFVGKTKIYVTTRTDNEPMLRTNKRCGLHASGEPYATDRRGGAYKLSLFIKE
jgi:GNAT superfamily N-acetyltransferase